MNNTLLFNHVFKKTLSIIDNELNRFVQYVDIDYIYQNNMINIIFENKKRIIINAQEYLNQLWMGTSKQGYHFIFKKKQWICIKTKKKFRDILKKEFLKQTNKKINFLKLKKIN
ncbi:iron donor protein CyaY [Buchnera aphidicola]|uniref:Iron-sulfur cluster assembly protein CyaY n=2 Tax=Buchnera aphidicola (Cinara cedri) TaxID=261318 RepID=Q056W8_BUCCC|nr:iron donor protein CyaY [Buchnera aphidicola]AAW72675.1 CyaY [Buchnera aphidicola (Cinara cedri)]ABJ90831.1 hypothetical protein BCc_381 [Buchnera aphidicola BCc]